MEEENKDEEADAGELKKERKRYGMSPMKARNEHGITTTR